MKRLCQLMLVTIAIALVLPACGRRSTLIIEPQTGGLEGNYDISITGEGFEAGLQVEINGIPIKAVQVVNDSMIRVKTPSADKEGPVDIVITDPRGNRLLYRNAFTYAKITKIDIYKGFEKAGEKLSGDEKKK